LLSTYHRIAHHPDLHSFPTRRSSDLSQINPMAAMAALQNQITNNHTSNINVNVPAHLFNAAVIQSYGNAIADVIDQKLRTSTHRSEEHTSELQSRENLVCRLLLEKKN